MAIHPELRPDDSVLGLLLASEALSKASRLETRHAGVIVVDNADGSQSQVGGGDSDSPEPVIPWIGDETIPGRPTGLSASCLAQIVTIRWDGTLDGGIPSDFSHIELYAQPDGEPLIDLGRMTSAGETATGRLPVGEIVDIWAVAYDNAHNINGAPSPHESEESEHLTVIVEPLVDQTQMHETEQKAQAAQDAADGLSEKSDELAGKITDITTTVNGQGTKLSELDQKVEGAISENGTTVKSVTELKQTVGAISEKVTQTTTTADAALSKATEVEKTANGIKTDLTQNYDTKQDALGREAKITASVSGLQSSVEKTYATKSDVDGLVIGTRNYVLDSRTERSTAGSAKANQTGWAMPKLSGDGFESDLGADGRFTFSFTLKVESSDGAPSGKLVWQVTNRWNQISDRIDLSTQTPGQATRCTFSGIATHSETIGTRIDARLDNVPTTTTVTVSEMKLERGDKATDWTPAPEDADTFYATKTSLTQTESSIRSDVAKTYATQTTVQELSSSVSQTTDGLTISIRQAQSTADAALTQGDELLYNGGFELGVDGWALDHADIMTDSPYSGTNYISTSSKYLVSTHPIPATQGHTYRFSCMFRRTQAQPDGSVGGLRLQCSDDGKTWSVLKNTEFGTKAYTDWTRMSVDATIGTKKWIRARIAFDGITNAQDFDGISIRDVTDLLDAKADAANAAGKAQDAQSRVGSIETCIRNTADGVRVGYTTNGAYTGYSALVNSNGSFDVLDADGKVAARFSASSVDLLEDADGARGKFEKYKDGMNISCPQTYVNETPADGGYCWCTIKNYEVAGARQSTDEHGGYVSVIQYQESPGGQTDWTLTSDGRYLVTPYDGWYLLNGIADVWKNSTDQNIWAFYRIRYGDGTYGDLCGATRALVAVGSTDDTPGRWYRQNLPTATCYLHAGDGIFMGISLRNGGTGSFKTQLSKITLGPRNQLNVTKLPFGNIYHGRKEQTA